MINIKDKKITIIGSEESGISAALLAKRNGAKVFLSEVSEKQDKAEILKANDILFEMGGHSERVYDCDFIITSPGVPDNSEVLTKAVQKGIEIISEIEFASWFTHAEIVAITGTNGKSTTTALTQYVLETGGRKAIAAGNIGSAFSNYADKVSDDTIFVLEVSSFQLDHIKTFHPRIATIINITPDHLDRYEGKFEKYIESKFNIMKNMNSSDVFINNIDDEIIQSNLKRNDIRLSDISVKQKVKNGAYLFNNSIYLADNELEYKLIDKNDIFIKGNHNMINSMIAILTAKYFNISDERIIEALKNFKGLEHRCEFVRELNGVKFINDSKATNIESTIVALGSYENPLVLILGGREYNNDYSKILDLVKKNVKVIIAIGETRDKIYNYFSAYKEVIRCNDFQSAIETAYKKSEAGDIVLFSPACKSFDWFRNYKHRGDEFKRIVNLLK